VRLVELVAGIEGCRILGDGEVEVWGIKSNSQKVQPGDLFCCLKGAVADGHAFIPQAMERGAVAALVEDEAVAASYPRLSYAVVPNTRRAMAQAAARFFGEPSQKLRLFGVTGTNGKTTTTYLIASILQAAGYKPGIVGTIGYLVGGRMQPAVHTTPEAVDLQRLLQEMVAAGQDSAALEVSSHALEQGRVEGCRFVCGVFTNLTRDHLDYHRTMEEYARAKRRLFEQLEPAAVAVVNGDDAAGEMMAEATRARVIRYGRDSRADVRLVEAECCLEGISLTLATPCGELHLRSRLVGEYNLYNIMAAVGAALGEGIGLEAVAQGVAGLECVPGRFERIDCGQDFLVVVDYAHTDDALENVLAMAQRLARERLITVFGCGGERDPGKRPRMGRVAARYSDLTIITSDNPRREDPLKIIREVEAGVREVRRPYIIYPDRYAAIRGALEIAGRGDVVVIAGKGHEDYQLLGDKRIAFDDREVARQILRQKFSGRGQKGKDVPLSAG